MVQGPYWLHVKEAWERSNHPNLHFLMYEDLKSDVKKELRRLNEFLTTEQLANLTHQVERYTSFGDAVEKQLHQKAR